MVKELNFEKIPIDLHYVTEMYAQPFQEFDMYYLEEDNSASSNNKDGGIRDSKVTISTHENAKKQAENNGIKLDIGKKLSMLLKRFVTWLANAKQKIAETFTRNFNAQIKYVEKNAELNKEIKEAIASGKFKPKVENFPIFHIPLKEIESHAENVPKRLKIYHDPGWEHTVPPDIDIIRAAIYPDAVIKYDDTNTPKNGLSKNESFAYHKAEIDYWTMEQNEETQENRTSDLNAEKRKKRLQEYFLFGKVSENGEGLDADSHYTNELTDNLWEDTCNNILNANKAIELGMKGICDALKSEASTLDKKVTDEENKEKAAQANADTNQGNTQATTKNEKTGETLLKRCQDMSKALIQVSNEYAVGFANTMQELFFKKCYNLYKDIVTEYKNVKDTFNQQQPDQQTQQQKKAEADNQATGNDKVKESALVNIDGSWDIGFPEVTNESFTFKEIDGLFLEAAKVTVGDTGKKISIFKRIIEFCKKLLNRIIAAFKRFFAKIFKPKQTDFERMNETVKKNEKLNNEILKALQNGSFSPKIENWPDYKLNYQAIDNLRQCIADYLEKVIDDGLSEYETIKTIRTRLYPPEWLKCIYTEDQLMKEQYFDVMDDRIYQESDDDESSEYGYDANDVISLFGNSTSESSEDKEYIDTKKFKPIFICFRSGLSQMNQHVTAKDLNKALHNPSLRKEALNDIKWCFIWNTVGKVTHSIMNHAGISLDSSLQNVFSYSTHSSENESQKGFVIENWDRSSDSRMIIYAVYIPNDSWDKVQKYINHHKDNVKSSKYEYSEITNRLFYHKPNAVRDDDLSWVCSTFTNAVLHVAGCNEIPISKSPGPGHLLQKMRDDLSGKYFCVYMGTDTSFKPKKIDERLRGHVSDAYAVALGDTDRENEVIGSALSESQMSNISKQLKNYVLFGDMNKEKYLEKITPYAWKKLIETFSPDGDCAEFKKSIKEFERTIMIVCTGLRTEITANENTIKQLTELQDQLSSVDDAARFNRCKFQIMHLKLTLQCVMETGNIFDRQLSQIFEKGFLETQYVLYRDTISVYNTYYKTKQVKESYVETTINNIDDLMTFDIPQYC